jgi:hypothetical protein
VASFPPGATASFSSGADSVRGHRQQAPIPATRDIDITPDSTAENLTRLSHALTELGARIRTEAAPEGLPFGHDAASLASAEMWNLICDDGEFDISFRPQAELEQT